MGDGMQGLWELRESPSLACILFCDLELWIDLGSMGGGKGFGEEKMMNSLY